MNVRGDPAAPLPKPPKKVKVDKIDKLRRKRVELVDQLSEVDNLIEFLLRKCASVNYRNPSTAKLLD